MRIRTFQAGDDAHQAAIYNEAASELPHFKPATSYEVRRRTLAEDFDPTMRFFAEEGNTPVAYCLFNANGRVSYPWCRKGYEAWAEPLFQQVMQTMQARQIPLAFAAYRGDWGKIGEFFEQRGFQPAREMINFIQPIGEMATVPARSGCAVTSLQRQDVPSVFELAPEALRVKTAAEFEEHLFDNPYFSSDSIYALRGKSGEVLAVGLLITEPTYADVNTLDPLVPCFRLGAFGTEKMQTKRIKGLLSFLASNDSRLPSLALDIMGHASSCLQDTDDIEYLAAQVPSDVPHLARFYQSHFRRQGSFPVLERPLA